MKKAALLLVLLIIAACFCWYIFDPDLSSRWIGYQSDNIQAAQPEAAFRGENPSTLPAVADGLESTSPESTIVRSSNSNELDGWSLLWEDEFDAPFLSMEYWTEVDRKNNYNEELQYYTIDNSYVADGCLVLTAKEEDKEGKHFTSGMVKTSEKLELRYGRIEARISLPVSQGIFPAFWLTNDGDHHELDILEMVGCEPGNIYGVCHYWKNDRLVKTYSMKHIDDPEAFHVYALEWDENEVRWYIDGEQFHNTYVGVPNEDMYVLFTLAVGGEWPGSPDYSTVFPISMKVDYVRLYQRES